MDDPSTLGTGLLRSCSQPSTTTILSIYRLFVYRALALNATQLKRFTYAGLWCRAAALEHIIVGGGEKFHWRSVGSLIVCCASHGMCDTPQDDGLEARHRYEAR